MGTAIDSRAAVAPEQHGAAWLYFPENGALFSDADLRNSIIDLKQATCPAAGGVPDDAWFALLDATRSSPAANEVAVRRAHL